MNNFDWSSLAPAVGMVGTAVAWISGLYALEWLVKTGERMRKSARRRQGSRG